MSELPFRCPQCCGGHFGSTTEQRADGSIWKISEECHDEFDKGCKFTRRKVVCVVKAKSLDEQWRALTGGDIPEPIASMPVADIERKLALLRTQGTQCFVPRAPVIVPVSEDDSMAEWDSQDEKHLNAYGQ